MMILPIGIEDPFTLRIQRLHHSDARETKGYSRGRYGSQRLRKERE
jgi:hypothetical protein